MIMDNNLLFSNAQSFTGSTTGTASSVIDISGGTNFEPSSGTPLANGTSTYGADLGNGHGDAIPAVFAQITTAGSTTGTASLTVQFQGSTDSSNWTTYIETAAIPSASLLAGKRVAYFDWPLKRLEADALPRYVRLNYAVSGGGSFSTGNITAGIVLDAALWQAGQYPSNFAVI